MRLLVRIVVMCVALGAGTAAGAQTFTKITDPTNPVVSGVSTQYQGAAWIDYNNDGLLDLFVANANLYQGDGAGNFTAVTTSIGAGIPPATGQGTCWADYDNDGDLDVYIASGISVLYINDGSGVFSSVSTGDIGQTLTNRGWSCAWADWNGDNHLDLAVTHPAGFVGAPTTNHLFASSGPPDYTLSRVTDTPIDDLMTSFTVGTWSDHDNDGDMDYFIGAGPADGTTQADFLYRNLLAENGSPGFERITDPPLGTDLQDGQIWNWIDYDNDGDLDAYLTNWGSPLGGLANRLYRNDDGSFSAITSGAIVTDVAASLGSIWGDYDNDGDLDVLVTNDNLGEDKYYRNDGGGVFTSVDNVLTETLPRRGGSNGDFDGDGDLDIYVDGPAGRGLFRNDTVNDNHWLVLELTGSSSNRSAIGAKVRAEAVIGGNTVTQLREVSSQNTFNGHNQLDPHFGLGDATVVESLLVEWPSGNTQRLRQVAADQRLGIREVTTTPAIPDGNTVPGTQMTASRAGADVLINWDDASCGAPISVNIYQGTLGSFGTFTAGDCALPPTGSATVAVPGGSWFLVASADGDADGSYGRDASGGERGIDGAGAVCPEIAQQVTLASCP